jgi:hypothetical protein
LIFQKCLSFLYSKQKKKAKLEEESSFDSWLIKNAFDKPRQEQLQDDSLISGKNQASEIHKVPNATLHVIPPDEKDYFDAVFF